MSGQQIFASSQIFTFPLLYSLGFLSSWLCSLYIIGKLGPPNLSIWSLFEYGILDTSSKCSFCSTTKRTKWYKLLCIQSWDFPATVGWCLRITFQSASSVIIKPIALWSLIVRIRTLYGGSNYHHHWLLKDFNH